MHHSRSVLALLGCIAFSGCGLIPIPRPRTVPGVITDVRVIDHDTRKPLSDAIVGMDSKRTDGAWMNGSPSYIALNDSPWPDLRFGEPIPMARATGDHWTPRQTTRTSVVRPWGIGPLGTCIYAEQQVRITARAPRHRNFTLVFSPSWCKSPSQFKERLKTSPHAELFQIDDEGQLTIHLPTTGG
jgi:hypothetical protein